MAEPISNFHRTIPHRGTHLVHLIEDVGLSIILLATLIAVAILAVRWGSVKLPYPKTGEVDEDIN